MANDSIDDFDPVSPPSKIEDKTLAKYRREVDSIPLLTSEKEKDLLCQIKDGGAAGKAACDQVVRAYLRMVVQIARQCHRRWPEVPLLDLIQDGNLALMSAARDFDSERGGRFSTYAFYKIRFFLVARPYSEHSATAQRAEVRRLIARMWRASHKFTQDHEREPTDLELAEILDIRLEKLWALQRAAKRPVSLDTPVYDEKAESAETLCDRIPSQETPMSLDRLESDSLRALLDRVASYLTAEELEFMKLRFGLGGGGSLSLREIAVKFGSPRQRSRIARMERQVLLKLRNSPLGKALAECLS